MPSDAVARVGDTVITKQQFDHWYESAAKSQAQQGGPSVPPDPPNFTKCIAALKEAQPKGSKPKDADLKKQCKQSYDQLKQQVMQFLIQSQWVQQEAEEQGVKVSGKEVRTLFEDQKKQAFPKERDYQKFLRTSGATEQDILFRIKLDALQNKLTAKIQKDQEKITDEDVEEYYEKNKKRFGQPERRDLNIVLTKTKAKAEQAKRELDGGAKFSAVAKKYSIDQASKANGGKLPDVPQGQQEKAFDEAVFDAEQGEIEGPVKTQFGWYVFEVTDVTEASQQSLDDAKETIRGLLKSEREQKSLQDFIEDFREDFKDQTKCREGFVVAECSNAPEETTDTNAAPGAPQGAPQGAPPPPPQGAPQQAPPPQQPAP
ncbi:MAG TPA: peptidyl-prolyl cis-trans isomerase [Thermoleophilaceae bacterium]|nr:peptidyl-prolyl cis-trans isomerase [Thermoleophilaceae bacterium]